MQRERRRKTKLNYPKLQLGKKLPYSLYIFLKKTPGGIYRHQGKGGQGDNPWPKSTGAAAPVRPRKRGYGCVSAAIEWSRARRRLLRGPLLSPCRL